MMFDGTCGHRLVDDAFSARVFVQTMLEVEASLADAQAALGLIPKSAAQAIAQVCGSALDAGLIDAQAIGSEGAAHGSVVVPLVPALKRAVALQDADAAHYVHVGATSQDILDTALAMTLGPLVGAFRRDLERCVQALSSLGSEHAGTPCLARTLLQPASVTSLGWKCVQWAQPMADSAARLIGLGQDALAIQLAGASGTALALGPQRDAIVSRMADRFGLKAGPAWQTQRQGLLRLACELAIGCGALSKCAQDLLLLGQFEVQEVLEVAAPGAGASSAMPHKRNPVGCIQVMANQSRVPGIVATLLSCAPIELERAAGRWQAELASWPQLMGATLGASGALTAVLERGLLVRPDTMLRNLDAVAKAVGHAQAEMWFDPALGTGLQAQVKTRLAAMQGSKP